VVILKAINTPGLNVSARRKAFQLKTESGVDRGDSLVEILTRREYPAISKHGMI
jgi:hypothetical protein